MQVKLCPTAKLWLMACSCYWQLRQLFLWFIGPSQVNRIIRVMRVTQCDPLGRQRNANRYSSPSTCDEDYLNGGMVSCIPFSGTTNCQEMICTTTTQKWRTITCTVLPGKPGHDHLHLLRYTGILYHYTKEQIRILADEACCHSSVNRSTFIRNLKTELSVATVKGSALVFQACISQLARKTGKAFQKGATCPHAEVG